MAVTDPIADLLTHIRNAQMARHKTTRLKASNIKWAIAQILEEHGYIEACQRTDEGYQGMIEITLRYAPDGKPIIRGIRRESKPGQRRYVKTDEIPKVLGGLGIAILSTSSGVMTGVQAQRVPTGGELLATVW